MNDKDKTIFLILQTLWQEVAVLKAQMSYLEEKGLVPSFKEQREQLLKK